MHWMTGARYQGWWGALYMGEGIRRQAGEGHRKIRMKAGVIGSF